MRTIHGALAVETREAIERALRDLEDAHAQHVLELEYLLSGLVPSVNDDRSRPRTRQSWIELDNARKRLKAALAAAGYGGGL